MIEERLSKINSWLRLCLFPFIAFHFFSSARGLATYQECPGTDCQPEYYIAIYREDAAEVVHARIFNNIQEDLNCLQLNMKEAMDIVRDRQKNGDIVFQPQRHHWVDGRARRRRFLFFQNKPWSLQGAW